MKKTTKKKFIGIQRIERTAFICQSVFFLLLALPFIIVLFCSIDRDFLPKEELVFEECTFVKYNFIEDKGSRGRVTRYYKVYVEEYAVPLEIDSIIYDRVSKGKLDNLEAGERIVVSIDKADYSLYYLACEYSDVLSYEDYLEGHEENYRIGLVVFPVLSCLGLGLFVANIIYYKKKGRCMPLR